MHDPIICRTTQQPQGTASHDVYGKVAREARFTLLLMYTNLTWMWVCMVEAPLQDLHNRKTHYPRMDIGAERQACLAAVLLTR